jgi:hypothetical protein
MAKLIYRIISWGLLALTLVSILLVLRKPSFPTAEASPAAARSFDQKISLLSAPSAGSAPRAIRFTEAELNSKLQESLSPPAAGGPATVKAVTVRLEGDKLFGLFTVEVSGKEVYLTVGGKLGVNHRAVEFIPTDIKMGSLPVPLTMVESTLRDRLSTLRDQMQLPDSVQDVRIENGEVVLQLR